MYAFESEHLNLVLAKQATQTSLLVETWNPNGNISTTVELDESHWKLVSQLPLVWGGENW